MKSLGQVLFEACRAALIADPPEGWNRPEVAWRTWEEVHPKERAAFEEGAAALIEENDYRRIWCTEVTRIVLAKNQKKIVRRIETE